ncbi:MAG: VWA domain-containing protein, partial [Pseudomonadota bacterium]
IPNPLLAQTAPLVIVVKADESMAARDIAPSRMERARHKILDLLKTRAGARTALIAYAGTAHRVTPLTEDPAVIEPYVRGLAPDVMPRPGDDIAGALDMAGGMLAEEDVPGAILVVADRISSPPGGLPDALDAPGDRPVVFLSVSKEAHPHPRGVRFVGVTPDGSDIAEIERIVARAFEAALAQDERRLWDDRGWMLAWPAALLMLVWFRRGWTMRGAVVLWLGVAAGPGPARADGFADFFLTADQQGQRAVNRKAFSDAADRFEDPWWKGYALYRAGRYEEAIGLLVGQDSAAAAFTMGLAQIKFRQYRDGVESFETALERRPGWAEADRNLAIARAIVSVVESTQEQSSTEDGSEGADEVRFDKKSEGGAETQMTGVTGFDPATADQWMRTVETRTGDFLRGRFALEEARGGE